MRPDAAPPDPPRANPYPRGFVYGQGAADPKAWSLSGLKIARALKALLAVKGRVLELGCGGGQYLRALRRHRPDLELHAVDLDPQAVAGAQAIAGVECVLADAGALPYASGRFSAVLGFDILEHVPDPAGVLTECRRVLGPDGLLHMYIPCEGNPETIYLRKGHDNKALWGGHRHQFTTRRLIDMITSAGFNIADLRHADYWLTQQLDYLFFDRLSKSRDPRALWAAQALHSGGGVKGFVLRWVRRILSAVTWLEGTWRRGSQGAMGVHITAIKVRE
ncbi:class I SAM-dependent methyltransferase [candidate division FCPU426 bacterium]|nr:class I SAM-dependent methyltransferase [candidate division FCPU426 bacterium]